MRIAACRLLDLSRSRHPAPGRVGHEGNGCLAEGRQDVPVAGIARRGQRHLGTGIEQGQKRQHETGRRPRRHHHPLRRDCDTVALAIMPGDALAQRRQSQGHRVAQRLAVERPLHRLERGPGRGRAGLAHLHVDDLVPLGFARRGRFHHVHDDEGWHGAALGKPQGERCPGLVQASVNSRHGQTLRCRKPSNGHGCALTAHIGTPAAKGRAAAAMWLARRRHAAYSRGCFELPRPRQSLGPP